MIWLIRKFATPIAFLWCMLITIAFAIFVNVCIGLEEVSAIETIVDVKSILIIGALLYAIAYFVTIIITKISWYVPMTIAFVTYYFSMDLFSFVIDMVYEAGIQYILQ